MNLSSDFPETEKISFRTMSKRNYFGSWRKGLSKKAWTEGFGNVTDSLVSS